MSMGEVQRNFEAATRQPAADDENGMSPIRGPMKPSESIDPTSHKNHAARILRIGHAEGTFERELALFRDVRRIDELAAVVLAIEKQAERLLDGLLKAGTRS